MSLCPILRPGDADLLRFLDRRPIIDLGIFAVVAETLRRVQADGAAAVLESARQFDAPTLTELFVTEEELSGAEVPESHIEAIRTSIHRVRDFHEIQLSVITHEWDVIGDAYGWRTAATENEGTGFEGQRMLPLSRVGVYVPGGKANYPSSVIMNAIPALVAGVKDVAIATPASSDGSISPAVLVACRELGITTILKCGGAAAIGAMALGFEGLPRVGKIVGPGNAYVNEAKRQLWGSVGLDSFAGPSEVCVMVDDSVNVAWAAADLITQIEHSEDNVSMLIGWDEAVLREVLTEVERQAMLLPRSSTILRALENYGCAVVTSSEDEAIQIVNRFAPEHLTIMTLEPGSIALQIENAGCILLGSYTPQSSGDFCSGPSHTLPTSGAARFASPVNVQDFLKICSISMLEPVDLAELTPVIEAFGEMEGFAGHAAGATIRSEPG